MSWRLLLTAGSSTLLLAAGRLLLTLLSCRDGAGWCLFWRDAFGLWLAPAFGLIVLLDASGSAFWFPIATIFCSFAAAISSRIRRDCSRRSSPSNSSSSSAICSAALRFLSGVLYVGLWMNADCAGCSGCTGLLGRSGCSAPDNCWLIALPRLLRSSRTAGSIGRRGPACAALYSRVMAPNRRSSASTCSALRARASRAVSSSVCTCSGSPFLFTGVYDTSRNALAPIRSAASAVSLAFLAALVGYRLVEEHAPAIMTAACNRPSSWPGAAAH